jgi:glycerophosphoryl diester phosphodiesterase
MRKRGAVLLLGHRGYRARFPENTLLGVRKAFEFGADGVECDLQKTADGRYVVIHDPSVDRIAGIAGDLRSVTLDRLRGIDVGGGERIPELSELLAAIPKGKYLDLELKEETLIPSDCFAIAEILCSRIDAANLMISSFEPRLLRPFKRMGYTVGLLVGKRMLTLGAAALAAAVVAVRPQYLNLPVEIFSVLGPKHSTRLLRFLGMFGVRFLFWTVNTAEAARLVIDQADIIVTDEVEGMRFLSGAQRSAFSR